MRGMSSTIAVIILLLIAVALSGVAWLFLSGFFSAYTKTIISPAGGSFCGVFHTADIIITNAGMSTISLAGPKETDLDLLGNMIPNSGFELDADGNNNPDSWGENETTAETVDAVLVTDLSKSMSDCMDQHQTRPDADTVLLMHFDDGTANDSSGWGNNGRLGNRSGPDTQDPAYVPNGGRFGGAFRFDGSNDYIEIPNDESFTWVKDMTIEAWINITDAVRYMPIISKHYTEYELSIYEWGAYLYFFVGNGTTTSYTSVLGNNKKFIENTWYHIAVVKKGSEFTVYINDISGQSIVTKTKRLKPLQYENYPIRIGGRPGENLFFSGLIDEVAIYRRALSAEEIKSHAMAISCPGEEPDKPSWCRYETSLCPSARPSQANGKEESYSPDVWAGGSFQNSAFKNMTFSPRTCEMRPGCDEAVCGAGFFNKTVKTDFNITRTAPCITGECMAGYGSCKSLVRDPWNQKVNCADRVYAFGPFEITSNYNYTTCILNLTEYCNSPPERVYRCGCTWRNVQSCGGQSPCLAGESSLETSYIYEWKQSCEDSECPSGERYEFSCVESGSCTDRGMITCPSPDSCGDSCKSFEKCCCNPTPKEYYCKQERKYCCDGKTACYTYMDKCCSTVQCAQGMRQGCCNSWMGCSEVQQGTDSCVPGLHGTRPDASASCAMPGTWLCRTEGGSCYICDTVAVRLAKKLDMGFVDTVFQSLTTTRIGLVSYGTSVGAGDKEGLKENSGKATLTLDIDSYSYKTGAEGETCISCAIQSAIDMLDDPGLSRYGNKRYVVLMSDGDANMCKDGSKDGDAGCNAKQEAIETACGYNNIHASDGKRIIFYTIGFGKQAGTSTLQAIAACSGSDGRYFEGQNPQQLTFIYQQISQQIGNAGMVEDKVYGEESMQVNSQEGGANGIATSDMFDVHYSPKQYALQFFRKINKEENSFFRVNITFYGSSGPIVTTVKNYPGAMSDANFVYDGMDVAIPADSEKARITFEFTGAGLGSAKIDDVYFGPKTSCTPEGGSWKCGDLLITKISSDARMYPYFKDNPLQPGKSTVLRDANCQGDCSYRLSTGASVIGADLEC